MAQQNLKYRKKPVVIEASQWWENGDHPDDYKPVSCCSGCCSLEGTPHEGHVVRYFRRPDVPGHWQCAECGHTMHRHGFIDTLEGGHRVCPGDYIITGVKGERYPCKPDIFEMTYEHVEAP